MRDRFQSYLGGRIKKKTVGWFLNLWLRDLEDGHFIDEYKQFKKNQSVSGKDNKFVKGNAEFKFSVWNLDVNAS